MAGNAQTPMSEPGRWQVDRMKRYLQLTFAAYTGSEEDWRELAVTLWQMAKEVPPPKEE